MTAAVELSTTRSAIILSDTFAPVLSGPVAVGDGTETIVTVTAAPTPDVTAELRVASRSLNTNTNPKPVTTVGSFRFGPFTVDDTNGDVIVVEARRTGGAGGIVLIDWAGLQGTFTDQPGEGEVTETGITLHPANRTVAPGQPAVFTVSAVGVNLSYQWERDTGGGFANVGTNQNSYTISSPTVGDSGDLIRVTVTGDNDPPGGPVVSNTATLTVSTTTASVTVEPSDQAVTEGVTATFTVTGTNIDAWDVYERTGGTGNGSIVASGGPGWGSGTVTHNKTTPVLADDGKEYRFELRGTDATPVYSRWALLTVTAAATGQIIITDTEIT